MDKNELLWKQYELHVNLYRGYLELALKMNIFYYAITGGILSYYLANREEELVKWSLLLPILMGLIFGFFLLRGAILSKDTTTEIHSIRDTLDLGVVPETQILTQILYIFGVFMIIASLVLIYLFFCYQ